MTRDVLILRHGETEWNRAGRFQGALDSSLTEKGRADAMAQREILQQCALNAPVFLTSPLGRARTTAGIVDPNVNWIEDARLMEIDIGRWSGQTREDMRKDVPHLQTMDTDLTWYEHAPEGEGLLSLERRLRSFVATLPTQSVIVTHGITSCLLRCLLLGMPTEAFSEHSIEQGVIYRIQGQKYQKLTLQGTVDLQ